MDYIVQLFDCFGVVLDIGTELLQYPCIFCYGEMKAPMKWIQALKGKVIAVLIENKRNHF
jgi:hypothetical protein